MYVCMYVCIYTPVGADLAHNERIAPSPAAPHRTGFTGRLVWHCGDPPATASSAGRVAAAGGQVPGKLGVGARHRVLVVAQAVLSSVWSLISNRNLIRSAWQGGGVASGGDGRGGYRISGTHGPRLRPSNKPDLTSGPLPRWQSAAGPASRPRRVFAGQCHRRPVGYPRPSAAQVDSDGRPPRPARRPARPGPPAGPCPPDLAPHRDRRATPRGSRPPWADSRRTPEEATSAAGPSGSESRRWP